MSFVFNLFILLFVHVVQKSIELLSRAKKPVILLGSQSTLPPVPVDKLRKAVEVGNYFSTSVLYKCCNSYMLK